MKRAKFRKLTDKKGGVLYECESCHATMQSWQMRNHAHLRHGAMFHDVTNRKVRGT